MTNVPDWQCGASIIRVFSIQVRGAELLKLETFLGMHLVAQKASEKSDCLGNDFLDLASAEMPF